MVNDEKASFAISARSDRKMPGLFSLEVSQVINPKQARAQQVAVKRKETGARSRPTVSSQSFSPFSSLFRAQHASFACYFDRETREKRTARTNSLCDRSICVRGRVTCS